MKPPIDLSRFRATLLGCAGREPRTRAQLFDACGGRRGVGRQRFEGLLNRMLKAGEIERAGEIANPLHGHGHNNNPTVPLYRARRAIDLDAIKAAGLNSAEHSARLLAEHKRAQAAELRAAVPPEPDPP